jgi:hypothetical protein
MGGLISLFENVIYTYATDLLVKEEAIQVLKKPPAVRWF